MTGAPQFTLMIRSRIHECAPDHSVETISVGALRQAASTMEELYEALVHAREVLIDEDHSTARADAALRKARGETRNDGSIPSDD